MKGFPLHINGAFTSSAVSRCSIHQPLPANLDANFNQLCVSATPIHFWPIWSCRENITLRAPRPSRDLMHLVLAGCEEHDVQLWLHVIISSALYFLQMSMKTCSQYFIISASSLIIQDETEFRPIISCQTVWGVARLGKWISWGPRTKSLRTTVLGDLVL